MREKKVVKRKMSGVFFIGLTLAPWWLFFLLNVENPGRILKVFSLIVYQKKLCVCNLVAFLLKVI